MSFDGFLEIYVDVLSSFVDFDWLSYFKFYSPFEIPSELLDDELLLFEELSLFDAESFELLLFLWS